MLTLPSYANKNFPYHVRTTQIGIMNTTTMGPTDNLDGFQHNIYAPAQSIENSIIIPLSTRTEDIFGTHPISTISRRQSDLGLNGSNNNNNHNNNNNNISALFTVATSAATIPAAHSPVGRFDEYNNHVTLLRLPNLDTFQRNSNNSSIYSNNSPKNIFTVTKQLENGTTSSMENIENHIENNENDSVDLTKVLQWSQVKSIR